MTTKRTVRRKRERKPPYRTDVEGEWLRLHRDSGQGYLLLRDPRSGRKVRFYQGQLRDDSGEVLSETRERAARFLAEYRAGFAPNRKRFASAIDVAELCRLFLEDRRTYASEKEVQHFASAFETLCRSYGTSLACEFDSLALESTRNAMVESGSLNRKTLNNRTDRLRTLFKWGAAKKLVPAEIHDALMKVDRISKRRGLALGLREPGVVPAVEIEQVEAVLPLVSRQVAAIIELMQWSGARCGEIVQLRPCDVDRSSDPWIYTPPTHKTQHLEMERPIRFGPKARKVLTPWLLRAADLPCFRPCEAEAERREKLSEARKAPIGKGNRPGYSKRVREGRDAERAAGETYTTDVVRKAIQRACEKAGIPKWSPHQVRHAAATRINRGADSESARLILGHSSIQTTAIYVERDEAKAREAAERLG